MTSISSLSSIVRAQPAAVHAAAPDAPAVVDPAAVASPSSIVQLSPEGLAAARAEADADKPRLTAAARFKDVGAALLARFKTGAALPVAGGELPDQLDNRFSLSIVTASGKSVDLVLASADGQLIVRADADEDLGDDEREAVAGLAKGFQAVIDGMTRDDPQIRLDELAQFDSRVLRSIDLHAEVALPGPEANTQKLDVHLDATQRKLAIDGPSGKVDLAVDAGKLETLGTRKQQAKAIDSYLKQFDQAAARGHADRKLVAMFKAAFATMNATSTREELDATGITMGRRWAYSAEDHAVLTGLADFSATVTQAPQWSNPLRRDEVDGFQYEVSQDTRTGGDTRDERSLVQVQKSRMTAQFHEALKDDGQLKFDVTPQSQNYDYHEFDDTASSVVQLGYKDGRLRTASLEQSVSQSERIRKYVLGKLQSDRTLPDQARLRRDLVASLAPYQAGQDRGRGLETKEDKDERRRISLDALSENIYLPGTRLELAERRL